MSFDAQVDKAWYGKTAKELADAPVSALAGVSEEGGDLLYKALGIKTIRQLGTNKYFRTAQAIAHLAE
jgi:hypothetical protein